MFIQRKISWKCVLYLTLAILCRSTLLFLAIILQCAIYSGHNIAMCRRGWTNHQACYTWRCWCPRGAACTRLACAGTWGSRRLPPDALIVTYKWCILFKEIYVYVCLGFKYFIIWGRRNSENALRLHGRSSQSNSYAAPLATPQGSK